MFLLKLATRRGAQCAVVRPQPASVVDTGPPSVVRISPFAYNSQLSGVHFDGEVGPHRTSPSAPDDVG